MSANVNTESESTSKNDDILKSLRQLNSCITLTSVKNNTPGSDSSSGSESSSEGAPDFPQLRGISIQGHSKGTDALLSNLLGGSKKDKEKETSKPEDSEKTSWLNEWSKKCLSISFSSKKTEEDSESEEEEKSDSEKDDTPLNGANVAKELLAKNGLSVSTSSRSRTASPIPDTAKISESSKVNPLHGLSSSISFAPIKTNNSADVEKAPVRATEKIKSQVNDRRTPSPVNKSANQLPNSDLNNTLSKTLSNAGITISTAQVSKFKASNTPPPYSNIKPSAPSLSNKNLLDPEAKEFKNQCSVCLQYFTDRERFFQHIGNCISPTKVNSVARKKTRLVSSLKCLECNIFFSNYKSFEIHHKKHITNRIRVSVKRCALSMPISEASEDSDSRSSTASNSSNRSFIKSSEDKGIILKLKITKDSSKGSNIHSKKVEIVNPTEKNMIDKQLDKSRESSPFQVGSHLNAALQEKERRPSSENMRPGSAGSSGSNASAGLSMTENSQSGSPMSNPGTLPPMNNPNADLSNTFNPNVNPLNIFDNTAPPTDRPSSVYQPQFESFPGDWFNEYDSGSRIAAAMTGSGVDESQNRDNSYDGSNVDSQPPFSNNSETTNSGGSHYSSNANTSQSSECPPRSNSEAGGGLFSQAVLGNEASQPPPPAPPPPPSSMPLMNESRQGSFEELCLNDSFGHSQNNSNMPQTNLAEQNYGESFNQNQPSNAGNDLLSELAYLNNGQSLNSSQPPSLESDRSYNSHGSNSGTPGSSGHPTPPLTDTSFRALATSPLNSPTSPLTSSGAVGPLQNAPSPLQQMSQMGQPQNTQQMPMTDPVTGLAGSGQPRLTIANNLMPTTSENAIPSIGSTYGQSWFTTASSTQPMQQQQPTFTAAAYMQNSLGGGLTGAMGNTVRQHAPLPLGYKPSPPPRIRGRPPLIGHVGRPSMMRSPGRPPGMGNLPPLMAGARGSMMPPLQRIPGYGGRGGQKRGHQPSNQSPSKIMRREDINVPARQKDNECQIIAVQNRADGIGVISNIQGGNSTGRERVNPPVTTTESTIHLSDSITLSVRSNSSGSNQGQKGEKSGDAGVVANLLASRGITVSPAEKEAANGSIDPRRLPTASDLNLSSAISVHPPTSRDRDGFAVPHPPSSKNPTANSPVDRPPRPPTVDLTQEVSSTGSHATRLSCSQCDRTFPTQSLLADHAKVHQQQAQTRMPYKCHLCTAGFSSQKGQQHHYQQFHQLHHSAGDLAIPVVDFRNPANVQRMTRLGIRSFLPLNNLQNRGGGGIVGIPILSLENLNNGQMNLQQWGVSDVLTLGPPKALSTPR